MSEEDTQNHDLPMELDTSGNHLLVHRSGVPAGLDYLEYREYLRADFFYSCGYCTLSEFEAQGIRFTIDHYEAQSSKPELRDEYGNLIYACDDCNVLKNDLTPPGSARNDGFRFFRPDWDIFANHFVPSGYRVNHLTTVGYFTIEALDMNRQTLRRIREIRHRLVDCHSFVAYGIMALRKFKIDQLPKDIKGRASSAISKASKIADDMVVGIDDLLRSAASSPLLDEDEEKADRRTTRKDMLSTLSGLYPGVWRGRKSTKTVT